MRPALILALMTLVWNCIPAVAQGFGIVYTAAVHPKEVDIVFSSTVNAATASDIQNYHFSDTNVAVTNVVIRADNVSVILQLSKPITGRSFILLVGDLKGANGVSLLAHIFTGVNFGFNVAEVGGTTGTVFASQAQSDGAFSVSSTDGNLGGTDDHFLYVYRDGSAYSTYTLSLTADFATLRRSALIARETVDSGSRFFAIVVTRSTFGLRVSTLQRAQANASTTPWPNAQAIDNASFDSLQLRGDGTNFIASILSNGSQTVVGQITPAFTSWPQTFSVGAVTICDPTGPAPHEINYQMHVEPHGDTWPILSSTKTDNIFQLRWPNSYFLYESSLEPPYIWTLVTNHLDFGQYENKWNIDVTAEPSPRFFRLTVLH